MSRVSVDEQTLDLIYSAAVEPSLWASVMTRLTSILGGEAGSLTRLDIEDGDGTAITGDGDPAVLEDYFSHFFRINPLQIVSDASSYVKGWRPKVLLDEDWMLREELERTEYYNDFLRPISAEWGMMIRLGLQDRDVAAANIGRAYKRGRFDQDAIATAAWLQPHLVRAYALSQKFASLQNLNDDLLASLDRSPSAMILLDGDGGVLHVNAPAEVLLRKGDVLCTSEGRLTAADTRSAQSLAAMIAQAALKDWEGRRAGSQRLEASGRSLPLTVTATPLRPQHTSVFRRGPPVLVCVTDPAAAAAMPDAKLAQMFGLTKAESWLALALHSGLSLREAATRREVSINTARVQLTSIMAKTGTHRQVDLIRLLIANEVTPLAGTSWP